MMTLGFPIFLLVVAAIYAIAWLREQFKEIESYHYNIVNTICERYPYIKLEVQRRIEEKDYLNRFDYNAISKLEDKARLREERFRLAETLQKIDEHE